jgi:hypothetical protein
MKKFFATIVAFLTSLSSGAAYTPVLTCDVTALAAQAMGENTSEQRVVSAELNILEDRKPKSFGAFFAEIRILQANQSGPNRGRVEMVQVLPLNTKIGNTEGSLGGWQFYSADSLLEVLPMGTFKRGSSKKPLPARIKISLDAEYALNVLALDRGEAAVFLKAFDEKTVECKSAF